MEATPSSSTSAGSPGSSGTRSEEESANWAAEAAHQAVPAAQAVETAPTQPVDTAEVLQDLGDIAGLARGAAVLLGRAAMQGPGNGRQTCFHKYCEPTITLQDYAERLRRHFGCSGSCYPMAMIYIDRLAKCQPGFSIDAQSCHMLLLTSLVLAAKNHEDFFFANKYYASVGGVQLKELNNMEAQLLKLLGFALHVRPQEFAAYCRLCQGATPAPL